MATSGSKNSGSYQGRYLKFEWSTNFVTPSTNVRNIYYKVTALGGNSSGYYHHNNTVLINNRQVLFEEYTASSVYVTTGTIMAEGDMDIDQDDEPYIILEMNGGIYTYDDVIATVEEWGLDPIPRYPSVSQSLNSKTSSSIKMNWSSDSTIDYVWYSINNGSSWTAVGSVNASSGNYNITGLSANTTYNIKTRLRRKDSQLTADSSNLAVATYQRTIPTISVSSKTVNSVTVTSGCNVTVSSTQYRIKTSSGSYGSYQNSATFTGLSPNTAYVVEVKKVGQASGEAGTATVSVTTYQIGTISSASNFNHGDNSSLVVANPSGASLTLEMKIGSTQIFSKSVSAGTVTNTFTDTQLDNIYKLYGTGSSLTVTYILTTTANSTSYTNSKTCTIYFTGNQKTAKVGNNAVKRAKVYIGVNGSVKRAVVWVGNNNVRKRCI